MTYGQRNGGNGRYGRGVGHRNRNRVISETTASIAGMRVAIVRKPIKNMYLRIKPPNADIVISAPQRNIESQLPVLLAKWGPIVGRTPTHITLRLMSSRWGSCTPKTGRIRLNLQLGLMAPRFLEYVLVHEMTHLWENGHGEGFQRRMSAYLPQWRQLRRDINRQVVL